MTYIYIGIAYYAYNNNSITESHHNTLYMHVLCFMCRIVPLDKGDGLTQNEVYQLSSYETDITFLTGDKSNNDSFLY